MQQTACAATNQIWPDPRRRTASLAVERRSLIRRLVTGAIIPTGLRRGQSRSGASTQPPGRECADSRDLSLLELRCLQHVEVEVGRLPDEQTGHCASHLVSLGQRRVHHR